MATSIQSNHSKKIMDYASKPTHRGAYFQEDANLKKLALVESKFKDVKFYWLVDPNSDMVYSTRFFAYGGTLSLAVGEMVCSLAENKNFYHATSFKEKDIEFLLRDEPGKPASTESLDKPLSGIPPILEGLKEAYPMAKNLALVNAETSKTAGSQKVEFESLNDAQKKWMDTPKEDQIKQIEEMITKDIRPGLNSDGGDITIVDLEEGYKLKIKWEGACGGCSSSMGATLSYVENQLRTRFFEGMEIVSENEEVF